MQVMPDICFPVTDSDYPLLYLPQPFGHTLRSLLFDKTDWQGAVRGVHQDRVSQQPARLRVSGGIPQLIRCRTVAEVNGGGVITDPKKMKYKRRSTGEEKVQKMATGEEGKYRMERVPPKAN